MNAGAAPPELHLPDLPEVSVSLGPLRPGTPPPGPRLSWGVRLRNTVSAYLPLLLMALLALFTWWLVKNTPRTGEAPPAAPVRHEPDYQMKGFSVVRYLPDGRMRVRIEGQTLRHYPDTDRVEIDQVRIHAVAPNGSITDAVAEHALTNGDASEVQLQGGARVRATGAAGDVVEMESDFLHAFLNTERVRTHLPVVVRQATSEVHAAGLEYDHLAGQLQLQGPVRGSWAAQGTGRGAAR